MSNNKIAVASEVVLVSGSPRMTVASIHAGDAHCVWFHGHDRREAVFPIATLVLADQYTPPPRKPLTVR